MSQNRRPERPSGGWGTAARMTTIGLTLALSVGIGIAIGFWLDQKFKTHGILVIVFSLVGIAAGFKQLIQDVVRAGKEQDQQDAEERSRREEER